MFRECSDSAHRLHSKKPLPWRVTGASVARHVERPWVRSKNVYIAEPAPELQPMCCEIGAPRREIGVELDVYPRDPPWSGERRDRGLAAQGPSRRRCQARCPILSRSLGATAPPRHGAFHSTVEWMPPTPRLAGASVSWRLSFHCGMNAAETSACRGIRIGCVSAPRR